MNAAQSASFEEGTGSYFTAAEMLNAIQLLGATAVFLYMAWLCVSAYQAYGQGSLKAIDMIIVWCRGLFVMMVTLFLLIS